MTLLLNVFGGGADGNAVGPFVVGLLTLLSLVVALAISIILVYHWRRYSFHVRAVPFAMFLYFAVLIPALIFMTASAVAYMQSL